MGVDTMSKVLAREVRALDDNLAPGEVITMQEQIDRTTAFQRVGVAMLAVLGGGAALALTRLLGYLLYKVSPRDPLAFGSALVVMTIASLVACFLPAWHATRTDPVWALRQ